jgi:hypothetical protein
MRLKFDPLTFDLENQYYRVPDSPKDYVCTKFGQNPLKDVDSRPSFRPSIRPSITSL